MASITLYETPKTGIWMSVYVHLGWMATCKQIPRKSKVLNQFPCCEGMWKLPKKCRSHEHSSVVSQTKVPLATQAAILILEQPAKHHLNRPTTVLNCFQAWPILLFPCTCHHTGMPITQCQLQLRTKGPQPRNKHRMQSPLTHSWLLTLGL